MAQTSLSRWSLRLLSGWKRLQVSYYGGKYSIHRLLALEDYTRNASLYRVLFVCIGTPLPMVIFVSAQALVPLQEPSEGWKANFGFWIRSAILSFVVAHTLTNQATYFIDSLEISPVRLVLLSCSSSILFSLMAAAISAGLIFPVPFFVLTLSPVFYVALVISYRMTLGATKVRGMLQRRDQLIVYVSFVLAQNAMVFTYPAYETLFRVAKGSYYQLPVILLLPIIKVAVKNLVLRSVSIMEDMLPEAVIFTVDFFNAVYVATCMQSASSATTIIALTVTDLSQTVIMIYGLNNRTATILSRLGQLVNASKNQNIVHLLCILCRDSEKYSRQFRSNIQIHSCLPQTLNTMDQELLKRLETVPSTLEQAFGIIKLPSSPSVQNITPIPTVKHNIRSVLVQGRIHPLDCDPPPPVQSRTTDSQKVTHRLNHRAVLRESLEILFTTECIVATAYLEAIVPFFYCCYMLVMVHLSSARYHTEMAEVTVENVGSTILPVFIFGLLQIASFILLAVVIKRNCGVKMMYQLAFVLETQMALIQGKLIFWVLVTLCFRVVHFGKSGPFPYFMFFLS
ncbi:hypothetical protein P3T76_005430 [Phytophthora citrophthora]|uniref:Uncharacterized protein n=1 Tax=Phytophthora citrophthora TaxID=4793 RepID=A0AAD9GR92_9STRA|nr:hypothetical protein P3T76_005430 [Phytophthora citrophthora]